MFINLNPKLWMQEWPDGSPGGNPKTHTRGGPRSHRRSLYENGGKRLVDLSLTVPTLLLLGPIYILVAALVRWKLGSPILFRQWRPGKGGQPFLLWKFRTLTDARDSQGHLLADEARMTAWGQRLRSTSLDELPELFNVLKGEMSLVGPRPLLLEYLSHYSPEQQRRHEIRPGITGLAQVKGRNLLSWEERFQLDLWYLDHCSLVLDLKILWRTMKQVMSREGISAPGSLTMPRFTGKRP